MMTHVSVILPTHNRPRLRAEALDSLNKLTFMDSEVVIVDDASVPLLVLATHVYE
jgi:glycosyltransferase involved in cell wall biosynthesis